MDERNAKTLEMMEFLRNIRDRAGADYVSAQLQSDSVLEVTLRFVDGYRWTAFAITADELERKDYDVLNAWIGESRTPR